MTTNKPFEIFCYGVAFLLAVPFLLVLFSPAIAFVASLVMFGSFSQAMGFMAFLSIVMLLVLFSGAEIINAIMLTAVVSIVCAMAAALIPAFAEYRKNKNPQS